MDLQCARRIAELVTHLTEVSATFHVRYGKEYMMKPGSPQEAWSLYQDAFDTQVAIARLLDEKALEKPFIRWGEWWERRDVIDTGVLSQLANEIFHLICYCAAHAAEDNPVKIPLTVRLAQETIAGTLHPGARQLGFEREALIQGAG